jgi:hypothetical protein
MGSKSVALSSDVAGRFLKEPVGFRHDLAQSGLFQDEMLAALLERHPDELTDVNVNDIDADGRSLVHTGRRGDLSGAALLAAVKAGRLWINLREASARHPQMRQLTERLLDDLQAAQPAFRRLSSIGNLLISGPAARVPYHADTPGVLLLHLVGRKRIWVYPNRDIYLPDEAMEKVALRETTEDLPYAPDYDAGAQIFDLEPGMGVAWPINAPHRVDNLGTFNVSLSVEYITWEARLRHGAYYCNGVLRRRFGMKPTPMAKTSPPVRAVKWALGAAFKRLKLQKAMEKRYDIEFAMTPETKEGYAPVNR